MRGDTVFVIYAGTYLSSMKSPEEVVIDVVRNDDSEAYQLISEDYNSVWKEIQRGRYGNDFDEFETNKLIFPFDNSNVELYICSKAGYYIYWKIKKFKVV